MKQQASSIWGADFGFVVLLAAMAVVGASAFLQAGDQRHDLRTDDPGLQRETQFAGAEVTLEPYSIEVIGVRPRATAQEDSHGVPATSTPAA